MAQDRDEHPGCRRGDGGTMECWPRHWCCSSRRSWGTNLPLSRHARQGATTSAACCDTDCYRGGGVCQEGARIPCRGPVLGLPSSATYTLPKAMQRERIIETIRSHARRASAFRRADPVAIRLGGTPTKRTNRATWICWCRSEGRLPSATTWV